MFGEGGGEIAHPTHGTREDAAEMVRPQTAQLPGKKAGRHGGPPVCFPIARSNKISWYWTMRFIPVLMLTLATAAAQMDAGKSLMGRNEGCGGV